MSVPGLPFCHHHHIHTGEGPDGSRSTCSGRTSSHIFVPDSQTQLSVCSSFQSRNLSDYQMHYVPTVCQHCATAGTQTIACSQCPSASDAALLDSVNASTASSSHGPLDNIKSVNEDLEFDKAVTTQATILRESYLVSPNNNLADKTQDAVSPACVSSNVSEEYQIITPNDITVSTDGQGAQELNSDPVTTMGCRSGITSPTKSTLAMSPQLEPIPEVPVQTDMGPAYGVDNNWLENSPNDPCMLSQMPAVPPSNSLTLSTNGTVISTTSSEQLQVSRQSSLSGGELDVFTHLFNDNDHDNVL